MVENNICTLTGKNFRHAHLCKLLKNKVYIGKISYKDKVYEGLHEGIIDEELYSYAEEHFEKEGDCYYNGHKKVYIKTINDSSTKILLDFNKWFNNLDANHNYIPLDSELTYLSDEVTPDNYRSKRLCYDLADGDISAYEKIISTLYLEEDREGNTKHANCFTWCITCGTKIY